MLRTFRVVSVYTQSLLSATRELKADCVILLLNASYESYSVHFACGAAMIVVGRAPTTAIANLI
jgi:hypothetical protein